MYPALQRMLLNGWAKAEWGTSDNNRRARYYTLTAAGENSSHPNAKNSPGCHPAGDGIGLMPRSVLVTVTAAGALATYWPARRATRVDPVHALRCE